MGGLKAGDGKYLMAVGAMRGLGLLLYGAVYGALLGGVIALGSSPFGASGRRTGRAHPRGVMKTWIPYGVALGLGTLVALALELCWSHLRSSDVIAFPTAVRTATSCLLYCRAGETREQRHIARQR